MIARVVSGSVGNPLTCVTFLTISMNCFARSFVRNSMIADLGLRNAILRRCSHEQVIVPEYPVTPFTETVKYTLIFTSLAASVFEFADGVDGVSDGFSSLLFLTSFPFAASAAGVTFDSSIT